MSEEQTAKKSWTASFGKGLSNLIFEDDSSSEQALDLDDLDFDDDDDFHPTAAIPVEGSEQEGEPVDERGQNSINAQFPDLYANMGLQADANTDTLLNTFDGMKAMDETARGQAMGAMIGGMQADVTRTRMILAKRSKCLEFVVKAQQQAVAKKQAARTQALASSKTQADAQVEAFRKQIAEVEDSLAAQVQDDQSNTNTENAALRGMEIRMNTEIERMAALDNFFSSQEEG